MSLDSSGFETFEHIRGFTPDQVFEIGIGEGTWPKVPGVYIRPLGAIAVDSIVKAGLSVPFTNYEFGIDGVVRTFVENEHVRVEGESSDAEGFVELNLSPDEVGTGTFITWGFHIRPLSTRARRAEPFVQRFAGKAIPKYAKQWKRRVLEELKNNNKAA